MSIDHYNTPHDTAQRWYHRHLGEYLAADRQHMVDGCANMLVQALLIAPQRAQEVALHVLGEVESIGCRAYIDMDRTTSHTLFLVDPANNRRMAFTAADLVQLARNNYPPRINQRPDREMLVHAARSTC